MVAFRLTCCFDPAAAGTTTTTNAPRRPTSIFLNQFAYTCVDYRMNGDTTATARSSGGHIMEVSFWIRHPPALSYFCARCHRSPGSKEPAADGGGAGGFEDPPRVVAAQGRLVLLRARFDSGGYASYEYFMYKADFREPAGEPPAVSLDPVPLPVGYSLPRVSEFAVVPRGHGGCHYLLAALHPDYYARRHCYDLYTYSSEDEAWTRIVLQNPVPQLNIRVITSKVLTLGEGVVCWVDFRHGMLMCNLHETNPTARYIPLPDPLPGNKGNLERQPGPYTSEYRDLACINGVLKLIEMQHLTRVVVTTPKPSFPPKGGMVYDSDLIMSRQQQLRKEEPEPLETWDGWRAVMWSRTLYSSDDRWEAGPVLDAADIVLDDSVDLSQLSRLVNGEADVGGKIGFKDLYSSHPILSTDGDDILYLDSRTMFTDPNTLTVALDLGTKRVKAMAGDFHYRAN